MRFEELDVESGFVLSRAQALAYLKWLSEQVWERVLARPDTYGEDIESGAEEWRDLVAMAQNITDNNGEWYKFGECAMSASGIAFVEMKEM